MLYFTRRGVKRELFDFSFRHARKIPSPPSAQGGWGPHHVQETLISACCHGEPHIANLARRIRNSNLFAGWGRSAYIAATSSPGEQADGDHVDALAEDELPEVATVS